MTFKLSVDEVHVIGIDVPLDIAKLHVLVDTVIPDNDNLILPDANNGLVVPNIIVQYVFTTPIALS